MFKNQVCEVIADEHAIKIKSCNYLSLEIEMQSLRSVRPLLSISYIF
jgi:hypothetical protein